MAKTFIEAAGENAANLTTPGYITPDNISTDLIQSGWIIKGNGVNGNLVDTYPAYNAGWETGNVSEIFTYLNPGGANVKCTKFKYNIIYDNERLLTVKELEIYWGKYVLIRDTLALGNTQNSFKDISNLSGIISASENLNLNAPYISYPEINLDTRKITKLPRYSIEESTQIYHSWAIETDDFATTVSSLTPQDSSTKISELSSTSSLQDNDLLVISRDEGSDGSFDTSYNTEINNIKEFIGDAVLAEIPPSPLYKVAHIDPAGNFLKNGDSKGNYAFDSCIRTSAGVYTFTFGESVPNKDYYVVNATRLAGHPLEGAVVVNTRSTSGFGLYSSNDNSTPADPAGLHVVVYLLS
jgi:hypothetical protein